MGSLSWLHLTDLHCGMSEEGIIWSNIEEQLFKDLEKLHERCGHWDLILFTGDLVQSGTEFQKLNTRLQSLCDHLKQLGSDPILLSVPGNHDLYRPKSTLSSVKVLKNWSQEKDVQNQFWKSYDQEDDKENDKEYRNLIDQAFKNYHDWFSRQTIFVKQPNDFKQGSLPGDFAATIEKEGIKLGIVGLNTAFLQLTSGKYERKLAVHPSQLKAVCGEEVNDWVNKHHLCLLLTHHPPKWLTSEARNYLNGEIAIPGRFALHLFGHMHESKSRNISIGGSPMMRSWQGNSLFGLEKWGNRKKVDRRHGYTAARIDNFDFQNNTCKLRLWPRKAELHQAGHWHIVADTSLTLEDDQGTKAEKITLNDIDVDGDGDFDGDPTSSVWELMPKAFPFEGRTRVIYTCRSSFEKPKHFKCPTIYPDHSNPNLSKSKTVLSHVPLDELESLGLSFVWYGSEILGNQEGFGKSALCCSEVADRDLQIILKYLQANDAQEKTDAEEISELLTDNLIIIGENKFSNHLFHLINHLIPWRHTPLRSEICRSSCIGSRNNSRYKVQLYFNDCFVNQIEPHIINQLHRSTYDWGVITFIPNPFAEKKWLLFLVGCSRSGQYLLLNWLRSQESTPVLNEIINYQKNRKNRCKFVQVIVQGKANGNNSRGDICRQWESNTIKNISGNGINTSFFTNMLTYPTNYSNLGDPITDISLLAKIPSDYEWIKYIKSTLPEPLRHLFETEENNGEIGFHTTLYEFLHTKKFKDSDFARRLTTKPASFVKKLKDNFAKLPPLSLIARQTRKTSYSLQVLVDIYASCESLDEVQLDLIHQENWQEYEGANMLFSNCCATAMDLVFNFCRDASHTICLFKDPKYYNKRYRDIFNINSIPQPLHFTILRFPQELSKEEQQKAEQWASDHKNKIWGKADNLPIILTRAFEYPFQQIQQIPIK